LILHFTLLAMVEKKWRELSDRIGHLVTTYNRIKKERDELKNEIENLKKQTVRLARESKDEVLLKERIGVLEGERKTIQEKVKRLLKILKEC
jgi:chromosome segregation ATPase